MSRALNQFIMFFYDLHAHGKLSRAELLRVKARPVRPPIKRGWNKKILDYEIETDLTPGEAADARKLK